MRSSKRSLIVTFMGPVLLGALSLAAYGCSNSNDNTGGTTANTINAASCSYADVQAAVDSAVVGDIVIVPAGTCSWTSALHITKGVILKGAGIDTTTIINEIVNAGAGDFLVIIKPAVIANNPHVEVTGFTLNANSEGGAVSVWCRNKTYAYSNFRIHHNKIENTLDDGDSYMSIRTKGDCFGLIDNNQFVNNEYDFKIYGDGRNSWDDYPGIANVGSVNYLYIENNTSIGSKSIILASGEGARWVYRYNTVDNSTNGNQLWDAHGDTRNNGVVGFEIYENIITAAEGSAARRGFETLDYRGGTGIIYNNSIQAGTNGTRTFIHVREEYNDGHCTEPVSNGYIWNNRNTLDNKILAVWESDPHNCIVENTDWWDDAAHSPGGESPSNFTYNIAASRPKPVQTMIVIGRLIPRSCTDVRVPTIGFLYINPTPTPTLFAAARERERGKAGCRRGTCSTAARASRTVMSITQTLRKNDVPLQRYVTGLWHAHLEGRAPPSVFASH